MHFATLVVTPALRYYRSFSLQRRGLFVYRPNVDVTFRTVVALTKAAVFQTVSIGEKITTNACQQLVYVVSDT